MLVETDIFDRLKVQAIAEKRIYYGVPWSEYLRLREEFTEASHLRMTYQRGVLEIMSPKRLHEQITRLIDMVVTLIAFETGRNVDNCGALTLRVAGIASGGEPDSCFYLAHEGDVRGLSDIDLTLHPPPDLVLEVDITSPSLDKFELYAAAGVPEIWRHDEGRITFYRLTHNSYERISQSICLPQLTSHLLETYLHLGRTQGSTAMLRRLKDDLA